MIYSYQCPDCGAVKDEWRTVAHRNDPCPCECGTAMVKLIGGHNVVPDLEPYFDENLECGIKSKQHRKQVMREREVCERYGKGWI